MAVDLFEIIPYTKTIKDLPEADVPHYLATNDGFYLRKPTLFGYCILPENPKHLKDFEENFKNGYFNFTGKKIPAAVMSQAYDFFRAVYNRHHHTEAELLLVWHHKDKIYDLFAPYQVLTGSSVDSIYDPADIPNGWTVVGSLHSHCEMEAFHSHIDTGDASRFNGLHITIGKITSSPPDFASMIMVNKIPFTYDISTVADVSQLDSSKHNPLWFDSILDKSEDILKRPFKTLTETELNEWVKSTKSTFQNPYASYLDIDEYWDEWDEKSKKYVRRKGKKDKVKYPFATRWSSQFNRNLPAEILDAKGKVHTDSIEPVLNAELERLFDIAKEYGLFLDYWVMQATEVEKQVKLQK